MKENDEDWKRKNEIISSNQEYTHNNKYSQNQTKQTIQNVQQEDTSTHQQLQITEVNSRIEYLDLSDPLDF